MPNLADLLQEMQAYLAVALGAGLLFVTLWWGRRRGTPWLPMPREPVFPWPEGVDFAYYLLLYFLIPDLLFWLLSGLGFFDLLDVPKEPIFRRLMLILPVAFVLILWRTWRFSSRRNFLEPPGVGITWSRWRENVLLGILAFIVVSPIVYAIHQALAIPFPVAEHPFLEMCRKGLSPWEWGFFGFMVLVNAPVLEELMCRGFMARWLEKARSEFALVVMLMCMAVGLLASLNRDVDRFAPLIWAMLLSAGYAAVLYWETAKTAPMIVEEDEAEEKEFATWEEEALAAETEDEADEDVSIELHRTPRLPLPWSGIFGSAMFFSVLHSSDWPAPPPLFVFAVVAGWLAWRTRSLIGPIVFHALFNLVALLVLLMKL